MAAKLAVSIFELKLSIVRFYLFEKKKRFMESSWFMVQIILPNIFAQFVVSVATEFR